MFKRVSAVISRGFATIMTDNRRIAQNTLIVYVRLILTTAVGLLTSRFVLQALGVSDYGLYNVVGSIIGLFAFISASLSTTTVRFLNYEKGKPDGDMNRMFNICNVLHIGLAILLFLLFEICGIWYITHYLNVAPDKYADAMFVFQVSTMACCLGIMNVPYSSLYNVHEKFLFPAVLSIVNTVLKLLCVLLLLYYTGNRLRMYALAMGLLTISDFAIYHIMSYRNWRPIVKWSFVNELRSYREVISFTNYNMLSTVSRTARSQGSNLLINFFFGTIVNAAYGIAAMVSGFAESFMASFDAAAGPQITQNISAGHTERVSYLANTIGRICIILSELLLLPLYIEIEFVLKVWLGTPPEGSALFCKIIFLLILVAATSGGIGRVINGSGKIKWFKIELSFFYLMCIPVGYILFKNGFAPHWILVLFVLSDVFSRIVQLILLKVVLSFDVLAFIKQAYLRPVVILALMVIYVVCYRSLDIHTIPMRITGIIVTGIFSAILVYCIGLKRDERSKIKQVALGKFKN